MKRPKQIVKDMIGENYKSQGVKHCPLCNQRNPYDRYENSTDGPTVCLRCGKDNNPLSRTYGQTK